MQKLDNYYIIITDFRMEVDILNLIFYISDNLTVFEKISYILGGVALFLFGIHIMGEALKNLAGNKLKLIIEKTTNTTFKGILTGMIITALIQSSSGTTAIVVTLISAGLMKLPQAIAVIMGANIGTTITSVIIGLNISDYSLIIVGVGALLCFFSKKQNIMEIGTAVLGFGLLFFGLEMMGDTLKQFANNDSFISAFQTLSDNPLLGVGVGAILTAIIQSSSAAIGIVQKLYSETDTMLLTAAIPILLGSNIGTTITAVISSLNSTRNAKRAALAHVIFNILGTFVFIILLNPFTSLMQVIENKFYTQHSRSTIATAHVIFNLTTSILLSFFVRQLVWIVQKIIKPTQEEEKISSIDKLNYRLLDQAPVLALEYAHVIIIDMSEIVEKMFNLLLAYFRENNQKIADDINSAEDLVDVYDNKLHDFLAELSAKNLTLRDIKNQTIDFDTIRDLERIADHVVNLTEFLQARYSSNIEFDEESLANINHMFELITQMFTDALIAFRENDKSASRRVMATEPQIDELEKKYRKTQLKLLSAGSITNNNDLHYVDILSNLERIGDHTNNIAENILNNSLHDVKSAQIEK